MDAKIIGYLDCILIKMRLEQMVHRWQKTMNVLRKFSKSGEFYVLWITLLIMFLALTFSLWSQIKIGDTRLYYSYALQMWHGSIPYRDFNIEYPPGILPFILIAQPLGYLIGSYAYGFMVVSTVAVFLILRQVNIQWSQYRLLVVGGLLLLFGQSTFFQIDVFAAVALFFSILALKNRSYGRSAVYLAIATMIKAFPLISLPAILLSLPGSQRWRYVRILCLSMAICVLPFIILSPSDFWHSFTYHTGRPLQIESGPAAIGFILHFFGEPIKMTVSHASVALEFSSAHVLNLISSVVLVVGLIATSIFLFQQKKHRRVATGCVVLLMTFIIIFKVGSPQYLLLPLVLLPFVIDEMGQDNTHRLLARFLGISLIVRITQNSSYDWLTNPQWYGGVLVVLKTVLEIEMLLWIIQKMREPSISKNSPE